MLWIVLPVLLFAQEFPTRDWADRLVYSLWLDSGGKECVERSKEGDEIISPKRMADLLKR